MAEEETPRVSYVGNTVDEKIASSQMFMLGRAILQRFGQGMTEDEKIFMNMALSQFVITPENVETAPTRQAAPAPAGAPTQRPPQRKPQ